MIKCTTGKAFKEVGNKDLSKMISSSVLFLAQILSEKKYLKTKFFPVLLIYSNVWYNLTKCVQEQY